MNRAGLVALLSLAIIAAPYLADAQQGRKIPLVVVLVLGSPSTMGARVDAFRHGMRERGYVEGRNVTIEHRYAEGRAERLPDLFNEVVALKPDVIVTGAALAVRVARQATSTIPIVMASVADPVESGLVASLARPGANVTGLTNIAPELDGKRLELLREILPKNTQVGFLRDPANRGQTLRLAHVQSAAQVLGIPLHSLEARNPDEVESRVEAAAKARIGALMSPTVMASLHGRRLADAAARWRIPVIYDTQEFVEPLGGLLAYGPNLLDLYRRASIYVDKILKGAKPADLPVEQPTRFELVVNLKTAKALGLTIPPSVLLRADQVIE